MALVDPSKVDRMTVRLDDGSLWVAKFEAGKFQLISEISPPTTPPPPAPPPKAYVPPTMPPMPSPPGLTGPVMGKWDKGMLSKLMGKGHSKDDDQKEGEREANRRVADEPPIHDSVFKARLSSVMTDNKYDRRLKGRTRGSLDMTRLWKAEAMATNVFTQKQARKNKEYNVVLLVDESGSMQEDEKIENAAQIAAFLSKAFHGLNVNLAIVGFNRYICLHKSFDEPLPDLVNLQKAMVAAAFSGRLGAGDNNDYDAMSYAYKLFKGRSGKNIMLMLSDGSPAPTSGYIRDALDDPQYIARGLKSQQEWAVVGPDVLGKVREFWVDTDFKGDREVKKSFHRLVNKHNEVVSIGIGLQHDSWQVPTNIREDDMRELKKTLLKELEKKIKRG